MFFIFSMSTPFPKGRLTMIDPLAPINRELLTIETDKSLSANKFYPRPTHAYICGTQL